MRLDRIIHELAAGQHSHVATWQLRALGASNTEIDRLRAGDGWQELTPRVLCRSGTAPSRNGRLMAAVLDASPGAAIDLDSAAVVWGVPGYRLEPVHVVRHRGISRRTSPLARVHEVVDLLPHHIKLVDGIPVVSPSRLICAFTATQHPFRVNRNLDWLIREGLTDGATFRRTVRELAGRGRTGSVLMRELDEARGPGYRPHDSGTEMRFAEILERDGQPRMRRQTHIVNEDEEWCGRVDFRDSDLPLIVEVQSEKYHSMLLDRAADAARRRGLEAAGFTVIEIWDTEIWHEAEAAVRRVRAARERLRHQRQLSA